MGSSHCYSVADVTAVLFCVIVGHYSYCCYYVSSGSVLLVFASGPSCYSTPYGLVCSSH